MKTPYILSHQRSTTAVLIDCHLCSIWSSSSLITARSRCSKFLQSVVYNFPTDSSYFCLWSSTKIHPVWYISTMPFIPHESGKKEVQGSWFKWLGWSAARLYLPNHEFENILCRREQTVRGNQHSMENFVLLPERKYSEFDDICLLGIFYY